MLVRYDVVVVVMLCLLFLTIVNSIGCIVPTLLLVLDCLDATCLKNISVHASSEFGRCYHAILLVLIIDFHFFSR